MSIFLYRLGGLIAKHRGLVLGVWMLVLGLLGGGAAMLGDQYDDSFSIPGTESQEGQDILGDRFDQTGATGQILFTVKTGKITDSANAKSVGDISTAVSKVKGATLSNPLKADDPTINKDEQATLGQVRFSATGADGGHARQRPEGCEAAGLVGRVDVRGWRCLQEHGRPEPRSRAAGPARVVHDPGHHLRLVAGGGNADHHVADRCRSDAEWRGGDVVGGDRVEHRPDPRGDAGPGRRHRLRAVHPVAASPTDGRGCPGTRVDGAGTGDRRQRRGLRRRDGHHRARRPLGRADPRADRDGSRCGGRSRCRRTDRPHPAAGHRPAARRAPPAEAQAAGSSYAVEGAAPGDRAPLGPGRHALPDRDDPRRRHCPRSCRHPGARRTTRDPRQQHRTAGVHAAADLRQDHRRVQ